MAGAPLAKDSKRIEPNHRELVRKELAAICADPLFSETTRMKRFLRYVVEQTLKGNAERLKGYVIGVEVFDRPDDFDPQADTIVRVQAGQLRRRLDLYYAERGKTSSIRIIIPKGRYVPTFEFRQKSEVDDHNQLIDSSQNDDALNDPRPSLAVMSLDNLSTREDGERYFFAEGLSAEIVNALVKFRSIRIVTMTHSVSAVLAEKSVRDVGRECNADFVLSGSVRRDKEAIRVTVSLIRCDTSEYVFSRVFDRKYQAGSLFDLQEDIAAYTAAAIAAPYGAVNRYNRRSIDDRQSSMSAYNCLLRYYDIKLSPIRSDVEAFLAEVEFETDRQVRFSTGWAIRALLNNFLATQFETAHYAQMYLAEANKAARQAIESDCENALGYFALYQTFFHLGDFENADRMVQKSLMLNPNDYSVLAFHALCLVTRGEFEKGLAVEASALRLTGRVPNWYHMPQIISDFSNGRFERAASLIDRSKEKVSYVFYIIGLAAKVHLGAVEEVQKIISDILRETPDYLQNASSTIKMWHIHPDIAQPMYAGLRLAGYDIEGLKSSD